MLTCDGERVACDATLCKRTITVEAWPGGTGLGMWWRLEDHDIYDFCSIRCVKNWAIDNDPGD